VFRFSIIVVSGSLPVQAFVWGGVIIFTLEQVKKILLFHIECTRFLLHLAKYTGTGIKLLSAFEYQRDHQFHL
jgi:hypothetical protein